jgi:ferredoxin
MKAHIDPEICQGHGLCYAEAPEVFTDDDEGYGQVIGDGEVASEHEQQAKRAADGCPERAITVS